MWYSQEQEERDFYPQSELQNLYDQSCMEFESGYGKIKAALAEGWIVVVEAVPAYCRSTDACIGTHYSVRGKFKSRDEAEAEVERITQHPAFNEDAAIYIEPRKAWKEWVDENLL